MKEEKKDVFIEATEKYIEKEILNRNTKVLQLKEDGKIDIPKKVTKKYFEKLKSDVLGIHAKRFNDILAVLPDKEFVKIYLQTLEYVKPKITRTDSREKQSDTTINIQVNYSKSK